LSLLLRIHVVRKCPELCHQHHVKQTHPEEERNSQGDLSPAQNEKDRQIRDEKRGHTIDQLDAIDSAGVSAIKRNNKQQETRLDCARVTLDFSTRTIQDQRFPHGLYDVIRCKKDEHVHHQENGGNTFTVANGRKQ